MLQHHQENQGVELSGAVRKNQVTLSIAFVGEGIWTAGGTEYIESEYRMNFQINHHLKQEKLREKN